MVSEPTTGELRTPDATFADADDLAALWVKAYQGEVTGEVLFATAAEATTDPDHRRKLEVLAELERKTREACAPAMVRHGLPTDPDPQTVADARLLGEAVAQMSWSEFMASFAPITAEFLVLYRRIGQVSPADSAESDLLVAHENALAEFALRELAGATDDSLELIEALPHLN